MVQAARAQRVSESAQVASADVGVYEASRGRLHADGAAKESAANIHEQKTGRAAGSSVTAVPVTAAGWASKTASSSYPHDASATLTQSRKGASPRARVNRGGSAQKERVQDLGR